MEEQNAILDDNKTESKDVKLQESISSAVGQVCDEQLPPKEACANSVNAQQAQANRETTVGHIKASERQEDDNHETALLSIQNKATLVECDVDGADPNKDLTVEKFAASNESVVEESNVKSPSILNDDNDNEDDVVLEKKIDSVRDDPETKGSPVIFDFVASNVVSSSEGVTNDEQKYQLLFSGTKGRSDWEAIKGRNASLSGFVNVFESGRFFWSTSQFVRKKLFLYEKPSLLVIARQPKSAAEVRGLVEHLEDFCTKLQGLDDTYLISHYCVAEQIMDLKLCKLRLSQLTTPTSLPAQNMTLGDELQNKSVSYSGMACFEIISPTENLVMSTHSDDPPYPSQNDIDPFKDSQSIYEITVRWENAISHAIIDAHNGSKVVEGGDTSWRHQLILGTLHSHVISGNYDLLQKVLDGKGSPDRPYVCIDDRDHAGLTPLHYACLRRSQKAVSILLNAGADCTIPTLKGKRSPCHLCCEQLDAESLSVILSCSKPKRADPNALDECEDTSMYVALMRGKSPVDGRNPTMRCLRSLEAWGGQIMPTSLDRILPEKHPIYIFSKNWDSDGLNMAFNFFQYRFPMIGETSEGYARSLGAIYHFPLHATLISLRMKLIKTNLGKIQSIPFHRSDVDAISRTLQFLLNLGFEPNERLDIDNSIIYYQMAGCTPLQILIAVALDILHTVGCDEDDRWQDELAIASECVRSAANILVSKGARIWMESPRELRPNRGAKQSNDDGSQYLFRILEASDYDIEGKKDVMNMLGGADRLAALRAQWEHNKFVKGCGQNFLKGKGFSEQIPDSMLPGGSDHKTCAICWKLFGKIRNRKYVCRASRRYVCEECSNNFVLLDGDKRRVSDGQYNLAQLDVEQSKEKDRLEEIRRRQERKMRIEKAQARRLQTSLQQTKVDHSQAKSDLFGNVSMAVKKLFTDEAEVEGQSGHHMGSMDTAGLTDSLNETRNAFIERGQKLSNLCEKTDALKNASKDFAMMAKQLADSQEKGLFGW